MVCKCGQSLLQAICRIQRQKNLWWRNQKFGSCLDLLKKTRKAVCIVFMFIPYSFVFFFNLISCRFNFSPISIVPRWAKESKGRFVSCLGPVLFKYFQMPPYILFYFYFIFFKKINSTVAGCNLKEQTQLTCLLLVCTEFKGDLY